MSFSQKCFVNFHKIIWEDVKLLSRGTESFMAISRTVSKFQNFISITVAVTSENIYLQGSRIVWKLGWEWKIQP